MARKRPARLDDVLFVILVYRPNGAVLMREERVLCSAPAIAARIAELRGYVRNAHGWTPTFGLVRATRQPDGSRDYVDITGLWRVHAM